MSADASIVPQRAITYARDGFTVSFFDGDNPDYPFASWTENYQEFGTEEQRQLYADWWIDLKVRQANKAANEQARRTQSAWYMDATQIQRTDWNGGTH